MTRFLGGAILAIALVTPVTVQAQDAHENGRDRQYYDSAHRDWHQWNSNEDQAYKQYRNEKHNKDNEDFSKNDERQQEQYWKWRHKHGDEHAH